ncbi:uncharacterized protein BX663DRAFT_498502 [Cokeromyces recurvatus]|uniref:uncharacterized protein n=1 Tax=Cokeromyces recurvatus TaxID=90255 RepID=UPI00221F7A43|nr:uncharacterized protein BX663DRAFT_498502 [Cokeromyces recurvatus]KAI7906010.1 hypothetical protein BX663DRAFT_498502 [Cokeromyces recurvatus]
MMTNNNTNHNNKENLMDFKVLSRYDDLFTDIFLDNFFLWFNTIKMNHDHRRPRVPHHKILDIIQRNILEKGKTMDAVNEILKLDYFKQYLALKSQKQIQEFIQHMKRYLYMYMPNAGYEIGDTRRYCNNGRKVEACLIATKNWNVGDEMRLLTGMIACLDPKDDAELKKGNRDFSVMWSTRKNCSCLFLGPARFANHDCDSNCKFIALGQNSIIFKVIKDIKFGEEITVYYGKHYFGENNCECKCSTCENLGMGYFASLETKENSTVTMNEDQGGSTRRSTRKRKSALYEDYTHTSYIPNRRSKRASIEPLSPNQTHSTDSLEELIGDQQVKLSKKEDELFLPPIPVSPTTSTTEKLARLKVMSIDFLCGGSDEEERSPVIKQRRVSDCPLLDMLVDAAVDAEYIKSNKKESNFFEQERGYLNQFIKSIQSEDSPQSSLIDSNDSKSDSAISLSPQLVQIKKEEDHTWSFNQNNDHLDDNMDLLNTFFDDVSDLSSRSQSPSSSMSQELICIACDRPLKKEDISEQVGADVSITNELATWTWSPSAIFTDWRPKRCPRCERHYTIFKQEWPNRRKQKKKKSNSPNNKKKNIKKKSIIMNEKNASLVEPESFMPILYQIQDDPNDLNYIPPSPLSDVVSYDE